MPAFRESSIILDVLSPPRDTVKTPLQFTEYSSIQGDVSIENGGVFLSPTPEKVKTISESPVVTGGVAVSVIVVITVTGSVIVVVIVTVTAEGTTIPEDPSKWQL